MNAEPHATLEETSTSRRALRGDSLEAFFKGMDHDRARERKLPASRVCPGNASYLVKFDRVTHPNG